MGTRLLQPAFSTLANPAPQRKGPCHPWDIRRLDVSKATATVREMAVMSGFLSRHVVFPGYDRETGPMSPDRALVADLKGLRRGRGVRRPKPEKWIGPELGAMLESIHGPSSGEELRQQLIDLVRGGCEALSERQLRLYQAALGATDLDGLLTDRLEVMSSVLNRDQRTLQRRLIEADQLVAERLLQGAAMRQAEAQVVARGWTLERFHGHLRFDLPQPEYITTRTIRVISPTVTEVTDMFSYAESPLGPAQIEVEVISGGTLRQLETLSETLWRAHIDLPRQLRRGERWDLTLTARIRDLSYAPNYTVMAPVRPCEAFDLCVEIGDSGAHDFHVVDGLPVMVMQDHGLQGVPIPIVDGVVNFSARALTPGLAYGLRWSWPT